MGAPLKGTLLNPTYGALQGGLIERVYNISPRVPVILTTSRVWF